MGRPPHSGGTVFRFTQAEVAEMEACLREANYAIPARDTIGGLAEKFSASTERAGRSNVQTKQVWNWFQNRRYSQRAKMTKTPLRPSVSPISQEEIVPPRNPINSLPVARGRRPSSDINRMEFEARSDRDRAWYDVADFMTHRMLESGDPEVLIRFTGFGIEEDEWVNVRRCVRLRSLPCEPSECVVVLPGDLVLCFQEGKDQALYFDAHVLDAQRRRHDVRGCRCRFLVRYDHDNSEEIVPLRKICRRPETDYRLKILQESKSLVPGDLRTKDSSYVGPSQKSSVLEAPKLKKLQKLTDLNARATPFISLPEEATADAAALGMAQYKNTAVLAIPAITGGFNENIKKEI